MGLNVTYKNYEPFDVQNLFMCLQAEEEVARLKESHDQVGDKK